MAWEWTGRHYQDEPTGRSLSARQMTGLRDTFTDRMKARAAGLATDLKSGGLPVEGWESQMRQLVKATHIDLAVLGRGGRAQMTPADWGRVGQTVRTQYQYLGGFADALPDLSEAQASARAGLYVEAATTTYERARAAAQGVSLPAYPGDGTCDGLTNCRCAWEITEQEGRTLATWHAAGDAATCSTCAERARAWVGLEVGGEVVVTGGVVA